MTKTDYFWTDVDQAQDRLGGTVILYDNEPVYVSEIQRGDDSPKALIYTLTDPTQKLSRKLLNSPKFEKFRRLPSLGWTNLTSGQCVRTVRSTVVGRSHGLSDANVVVEQVVFNEPNAVVVGAHRYRFRDIRADPGFTDAHHGRYPALDKILAVIKPSSAIAYSRTFCVIRDQLGIRWLYRQNQPVGIFVGADTFSLCERFAYLREEITAEPAFTLNTIREF